MKPAEHRMNATATRAEAGASERRPVSALQTARTALLQVGGRWIGRPLTRYVPKLFMYHRFSPERRWGCLSAPALARQLQMLRSAFDVVSMDDVAAAFGGGEPLPPNSVAVTVDDGYADFFTVALPIFQAHRVPVTLYVATAMVDQQLWYWTDQLKHALLQTSCARIHVDHDAGSLEYELGDAASRHAAWSELADRALMMGEQPRREFLERIWRTLDSRPPQTPPEDYRVMTWDEVRTAQAHGVTIGSHTLTHPRLSGLDAAEKYREIAESRARLQEMLQTPVRHFCYPFGRREDYDAECCDLAQAAGYSSAVTAVGDGEHCADAFELRRYGASESMSDFAGSLNGLKLVRAGGPFWSRGRVYRIGARGSSGLPRDETR